MSEGQIVLFQVLANRSEIVQYFGSSTLENLYFIHSFGTAAGGDTLFIKSHYDVRSNSFKSAWLCV